MRRLLGVILLPSLVACPFAGGGPTPCTREVQAAMSSATGTGASTDGGTLVTLQWPAPTMAMPPGYFSLARVAAGQPTPSRFRVTSDAGAEAQFEPIDRAFAFTVVFPEPDRLAAMDACDGTHGGMADEIELEVTVSAPADGGARDVSTSARISLGAF